MSSLIEQAALRLDQLRRAGADVPDNLGLPVDVPAGNAPPANPAPANPAQLRQDPPVAPLKPSAPAPGASHSKEVQLDLEALSASGIVTSNAPRSQIADQYRVIKRPLIANAMGKGAAMVNHGNLIMVTSALAGEGKSFTAINLAMSIATELDNTVMLVDADVARPSVLRVLGLPPARGLLDVLVDDSIDLSDVLLRTNVDKLTILPSGTQHVRATELLASEGMVRLLDDMANRYSDRIIIFDSPPLLLTTESRVLATHMGQIVIVVQAEKTLQSQVRQALATIETCPVKLMILNQAVTHAIDGYGYGYGGYGYGYGKQNA